MAAAEYYTGRPTTTAAPQSPYQQAQRPQPSQYHSSGQYSPGQLAPHYQPVYNTQQEVRPSVHFADQTLPQRPQRQSFSGQAPIPIPQHRPSFSHQSPNNSQQYPRPYPQNQPHFQDDSPPSGSYPGSGSPQNYGGGWTYPSTQYRPYSHNNFSDYSLNSGSFSDPEQRRRRHRRHEHRDHEDREAKDRPRKHRSRSSNADGLIGAAGGGLIGDLIFPGLGTVGGVLVGWLGGKDYASHRRHREDKLEKEQYRWEERFGYPHHGADGSGHGRRRSEH